MKNQMSGFQDELTGALIGLAKACKMNIRQAAVTRLLMEGLITTVKDADFNHQAVADMLEKVRNEKNRIAPGCAICKSVCGNTSDYDIKNVWTCDEEIRFLKFLILSGIKGIAVYAHPVMGKGYENDKIDEFFYKALSIISYDLTMEDLLPVVAEMADMNQIINRNRQAGSFITIPDYESMHEFLTRKMPAMLEEKYHISLIPMPEEDLKKITDQLILN